jgi:hypothetical protein
MNEKLRERIESEAIRKVDGFEDLDLPEPIDVVRLEGRGLVDRYRVEVLARGPGGKFYTVTVGVSVRRDGERVRSYSVSIPAKIGDRAKPPPRYSVGDRVVIGEIDRYAFNGRESATFPPTDGSLSGRVGRVKTETGNRIYGLSRRFRPGRRVGGRGFRDRRFRDRRRRYREVRNR